MNYKVYQYLLGMKNTPLLQNSNIPMEYTPAVPILTVRNGFLCMLVPFARYQITGKKDGTLVYPVRHYVMVSLPDFTIVAISDLRFEKPFESVDFGKPVGVFRHEAIRHLDRKGYEAAREELLALYDKLIAQLTGTDKAGSFTADDDMRMTQLLRMLVEPSLKPFYKVLDADFYNRYLAERN